MSTSLSDILPIRTCQYQFVPVSTNSYLSVPIRTCQYQFVPVNTNSYLSIAGIRSRLNQAPVRCMLNPASIIEPASILDGWKKAGLYRESGGVSEFRTLL